MKDKVLWALIEGREKEIGVKLVRETLKQYLLRKTYAGVLPTLRRRVPSTWLTKAWAHQKGLCKRCGRPIHLNEAEGDHWIPLAKGGEHKQKNIVALCLECNRKKNANDPVRESKLTGKNIVDQVPYQDESDV